MIDSNNNAVDMIDPGNDAIEVIDIEKNAVDMWLTHMIKQQQMHVWFG